MHILLYNVGIEIRTLILESPNTRGPLTIAPTISMVLVLIDRYGQV